MNRSTDAAGILEGMAATFRERQKQYRNSYKMVSQLLKVLFPEGVPSHITTSEHFHLFELKLVKLTRFATSGLTHIESIHDDGDYSAMIEAILNENEK